MKSDEDDKIDTAIVEQALAEVDGASFVCTECGLDRSCMECSLVPKTDLRAHVRLLCAALVRRQAEMTEMRTRMARERTVSDHRNAVVRSGDHYFACVQDYVHWLLSEPRDARDPKDARGRMRDAAEHYKTTRYDLDVRLSRTTPVTDSNKVADLVEALRRIRYAKEGDNTLVDLVQKVSDMVGADPAADEEFMQAVRYVQRVALLKKLGVSVTHYEPRPGPHPHVVLQMDGEIVDPTVEQERHDDDEAGEANAIVILAQTALSPFAAHAARMEEDHARRAEGRTQMPDTAEPVGAISGLTFGDVCTARSLATRISTYLQGYNGDLWGIWSQNGQCWAKNGHTVLLFPNEEEAKLVATAWSDREPARRSGYVWLPRLIERSKSSKYARPRAGAQRLQQRQELLATRTLFEHTSKLLDEAREHIMAMQTMPPRRFALWDPKSTDWVRAGTTMARDPKDSTVQPAGSPMVWDDQEQARDAATKEFQRTDARYEVRPFEAHYGTNDVSEPSLRTRVEKYWQLRCDYYDMWREDFHLLQEAWRWVSFARERIAQLTEQAR